MTQKTVVRPSVEAIIVIHSELIHQIGGLDGIRDENLLAVSVNSAFQTFDSIDLCPTLVDIKINCINKELADLGLGLADGSYNESYLLTGGPAAE
jgi:hypothetical protein